MNIIGLILNYNNPEYTDRLVENIREVVKREFNFFVIDNGSDPDKVSKYTTHKIEKNCRLTGGFNFGLEQIQKSFSNIDGIWFFTNDCYFLTKKCPLDNMISYLNKYPDIGIIHPSEYYTVSVIFDVLNDGTKKGLHYVVDYDFVCPIFTSKMMDLIGWKLNPEFYNGWGHEYETSYICRKNNLRVVINHDIILQHDTSAVYDLGRDKTYKDRQMFYNASHAEMTKILVKNYGSNWYELFRNNHTEEVGTWKL